MSSVPLNQNGDCLDEIPVEPLLQSDNVDCGEAVFPEIQSDCYDAGDVFGEPEILPRIGDEYQAQLPPLIEQPKHLPYSETGHHSIQDFLIGLPIPLTWVSCPKHVGSQTISDFKHPDFKIGNETEIYGNGEIEHSRSSVKHKEEFQNISADCCGEGHLLVPGLLSESWSDTEKAIFLLALYIFEKNFVEVRKFVGTKNMGPILSYFYGKFYGSDVCRRWSEGRKTRTKKCVYGQRIFSGLRQPELLSRLIPRVSEECKNTLVEVSKTFGDDKMSLSDYVSSLKALVGADVLVDAVGVGKGKQDLTGMALEPSRCNQAVPVRPEIPAGKACSSLTNSEIVKFLSGDYRLSKARSNDLFWEAVWPRLLARGWHSEQPQNQGYVVGSKHFLVFLMPGVKKFSRRKLVKGDDYFDSITDVLSKVAKEPGLIELENEEGENKKKEEANLSGEIKLEEDEKDQPTRQRHFYLQPRVPNRSFADAIKFTVVDTSLPGGNVRQLRSVPSQVFSSFISLDHPEDSEESDDSTKSGGKHVIKSSVPIENKGLKEKKKPTKVSKSSLSRKQKQGAVDNVAPLSKRCRILTANSNEEKRDMPRLENWISCCPSGIHESNGNFSAQVSPWQDKLSSTSSSKGSPCESIEQAPEPTQENPQGHFLIDLNQPQVPPDFGNYAFPTNSRNEAADQSVKTENQSLASSSVVEARTEEPAVVNPRRLSTRYRPPTTRTMEAVANGYLTVSRRRKRTDTTSSSRPSQRPRGGTGPTESPNSSVASLVEENERGASSSGTQNVPDNSHDQADGNEESHSRQ